MLQCLRRSINLSPQSSLIRLSDSEFSEFDLDDNASSIAGGSEVMCNYRSLVQDSYRVVKTLNVLKFYCQK